MENKEQEIWRVIEEFPNYSVSSWGNVRNDKTGRVLKPSACKHGYCVTYLFDDFINRHKKYIHRLVSYAFVDNFNKKPFVNHINGIKNDNYYKNLEWVTSSENAIHKHYVLGKGLGENNHLARISNFEVLLICEMIKYMPFKKVAKLIGPYVNERIINNIANGTNYKSVTNHLLHIPYKSVSTLTKYNIIDICEMFNNGIEIKTIAELNFKCAKTIRNILNGKTHKKYTQDLKYLPYHNK